MDQTCSFKNKELLIITKNADTHLYISDLENSAQNFKANGQAVLLLALGEHGNLWFLIILLLVHHQNSPDTLPLIQLEARALFIDVHFFLWSFVLKLLIQGCLGYRAPGSRPSTPQVLASSPHKFLTSSNWT